MGLSVQTERGRHQSQIASRQPEVSAGRNEHRTIEKPCQQSRHPSIHNSFSTNCLLLVMFPKQYTHQVDLVVLLHVVTNGSTIQN